MSARARLLAAVQEPGPSEFPEAAGHWRTLALLLAEELAQPERDFALRVCDVIAATIRRVDRTTGAGVLGEHIEADLRQRGLLIDIDEAITRAALESELFVLRHQQIHQYPCPHLTGRNEIDAAYRRIGELTVALRAAGVPIPTEDDNGD